MSVRLRHQYGIFRVQSLQSRGRIKPSKRDLGFLRLGSFQNVKPTLASSCSCVNSRRPQSVVVSPGHFLLAGHQHYKSDTSFHLVLRNHHRLESGHDNSPVGKKQWDPIGDIIVSRLHKIEFFLFLTSLNELLTPGFMWTDALPPRLIIRPSAFNSRLNPAAPGSPP